VIALREKTALQIIKSLAGKRRLSMTDLALEFTGSKSKRGSFYRKVNQGLDTWDLEDIEKLAKLLNCPIEKLKDIDE
jgi:hypothetical protein